MSEKKSFKALFCVVLKVIKVHKSNNVEIMLDYNYVHGSSYKYV